MNLSPDSMRKVLSFMDDISSHREPDLTHWLSSFESTFGYSQSLLWSCDKNLSIHCITSRNIEQRAIEEYDQYFYSLDLLAPKVVSPMLKEGRVLRLRDIVPGAAYEKNPYYHDYMLKYQHYHLMTVYLVSGQRVVGLIDLIRSKNEAPFSDEEVMKLEFIARFLSQRLEMYKQTVPFFAENTQVQLTRKEKEILEYVRKGYSNEEISAQLYISVNTVKTHLLNLYRKTGASNRTELSYKMIL
ncbi:helix-turn-helix transcriptional regulator [Paenibacillus beijingensis]|uniref:helix-turn-helix transcriptional regulator n=1 Tax=Paenibacillus beijingensis TaxID=1126833 RepID=UPI0011DDB014|nr:LuxR family transcriptional regulator [Paenibacillus beijingensis]